MPRPGRKWILATLVGAIVLAIGLYVTGGLLQLYRLAAFTYFYSGYNIFAQPSFDIPRLPPAENFELVGHIGGAPSAVSVSGRYAYVGYGSDLVVIDVGNPEFPRIVANLTLLSCINDISVNGTRAYVADGRGGLRIIDISDPLRPRELSNFGHRSAVKAVALTGNMAYAAGGMEGVQVLDCADGTSPRLSGFRDQAEGKDGTLDCTRVATAGTHLYVSNGGTEVRILDITEPNSPSLIATTRLQEGGDFALAAEGDSFVVAGGTASIGLRIYGMSGGKAVALSSVKVPEDWYSSRAVMKQGYIYVAAGGGLVTVDARNPAKSAMVSELKTHDMLTAVDIENDRAYVTTRAGDFLVVDIANRTEPKILGVLNYPMSPDSVAVCKDNLIVASRPGALFGFRMSPQGPSAKDPRYLAKCDYPRFVACSGGTIAVYHESESLPGGNRDWLQVARLDGGGKIVEQSEVAVPDGRLRPVFVANMITVGGNKGLHTAELPLDRKHPGTRLTPFPRGVEELAAGESVVFVATDRDSKIAELRAYDATHPDKLRLLQTIPLPDSIDGLYVSGKYLYVTAGKFLGKNNLIIFDVTSPTDIKRLSTTPLFGGTSVEVDGGIAYVEEVGRVSAIDVSDPLHPAVIGKIETIAVPMNVSDLSASDGFLYLSAAEAGLYVYRLNRPSGRSKGQ